ncbi:1201_t:CDS:2 [Funneliformis mosseae]|uniref:1201_t:CDS:1 n=1 Tax=Funneliformis mosseae TaxID=27381 RepID=A0A9N9AXG7_FUNMO|nr:1201_t:CDS:2 [Funneliformis mosseae]
MPSLKKFIQQGDLSSLRNYLNALPLEKARRIINTPDNHGDTLVHFAARYHKKDILSFLIEDMGGYAMAVNKHGRQPLYEAIDNFECVKYLCEQNVDIDCMKRGDWTPLMTASMKGNLNIVKELVKHGVNVDFLNKDGHLDIVMYLHNISPTLSTTSSNSGKLPIHTAAQCNHSEIVFQLLSSTHNEETKRYLLVSTDNGGTNLLQNSVTCGNLQMVKRLVDEYDVKIDHKDKLGREAIHLAAMIGNEEMIRFLLEKGANLNVQDYSDKFTPLHHAAKEGYINVVKYLVNTCHANTDIKDHHERTVKDVAILWNRQDIADILK